MGCSSCGTTKNGKPAGCKSNGGCSTGGCNKLNTFDWLADIPLYSDGIYDVVEVSFNNGARKDFFRKKEGVIVDTGDWVAVEAAYGHDIGRITLSGELVKLQMKKKKVKDNEKIGAILRKASDRDMERFDEAKEKEQEVLVQSRAIARQLSLDMKVGQVEVQGDGKKVTFYYTAEDRVDFRQLIKEYAREFKMKIEMRQIGARQEAAKVGGLGACGRELCCSTWLSDFKSVTTSAARYQNLAINQSKLSGQCGRLKCCLNYELDTYMDALSVFPEKADVIKTKEGDAYLQKTDIFKQLMFYSYPGKMRFYKLTVEEVKDLLSQVATGKLPDNLEIEREEDIAAAMPDKSTLLDGVISLEDIERKERQKRNKRRKSKKKDSQQRPSGQTTQAPKPAGEPQKGQQPRGEQGGQGQQGGGNRRKKRRNGPRRDGNKGQGGPTPNE